MTIKEFFETPQRGVMETRAAKSRVFVFSTRGWSVIEAHLSKTFGSGAAVVMAEMGTAYGRGVAEEVLRVSSDPRTALSFILDLAAAAGWGSMTFDGDVAMASDFTITVKECTFCAGIDTGRSAVCHFLGGVMRGAAQDIFKAPYKVKEENCTRKGDDFCTFVLQRQ